jgi:tryptophan synthase beta chain
MDALQLLSPHRGHHPGHRIRARAGRRPETRPRAGPDAIILVNLSGRGDKDVATAGAWFGLFDEGAVQA